MVSAPRCRPGARGLLALLLLLPLPGARGLCGTLPRLSHAIPHDTSRTEGFPIGTEVTYRCRDGFVKIPGQSDTLVCLSNSEWSAIGEFCGASCGAPPRLKSATLSKEDGQKNYSPPGSTVSYVCRPGYESTEVKPVIICLENLTWSEAPEFCRGKSCGIPKGPEHGRAVVLTNDLFGARANIICDDGFRLHGRTFIQCMLKGDRVEWSQLPTCQVTITQDKPTTVPPEGTEVAGISSGTCDSPPRLSFAELPRAVNNSYPVGTELKYSCRPGYILGSGKSPLVTCLENSTWSVDPEFCVGTCDSPPRLSFAELPRAVNNSYPVGTELKYSCRPGYILGSGKSPLVTCLENSTWSVDPEFCVGTCDSPPRLSFAELPRAVNNSYPVGTELKYSCRPGYILGSGKSPLVTCLENSTWLVDPEFCVGRSCKQLELENGRVDLTDLRFGATATFSCNGGYRLIGTTSAQCVAVGNGVDWDKELPHCDVIITQDKPTTVPPEGAEVAETSSGSDLNTAGNSAEPEGGALVIITQDKPTTVPPERAEVSGTSSELGFYTHIGIPSICITFAIGIVAALNKIWQKKKGSYNVNPDSPKYQITTT